MTAPTTENIPIMTAPSLARAFLSPVWNIFPCSIEDIRFSLSTQSASILARAASCESILDGNGLSALMTLHISMRSRSPRLISDSAAATLSAIDVSDIFRLAFVPAPPPTRGWTLCFIRSAMLGSGSPAYAGMDLAGDVHHFTAAVMVAFSTWDSVECVVPSLAAIKPRPVLSAAEPVVSKISGSAVIVTPGTEMWNNPSTPARSMNTPPRRGVTPAAVVFRFAKIEFIASDFRFCRVVTNLRRSHPGCWPVTIRCDPITLPFAQMPRRDAEDDGQDRGGDHDGCPLR